MVSVAVPAAHTLSSKVPEITKYVPAKTVPVNTSVFADMLISTVAGD